MADRRVREAVAIFPDAALLQAAVDDLLVNGFDRSLISLMSTSRSVERSLGHLYRRIEDVADDPRTPHAAFVGVDSRVEGKGAAAGGLAYVGACAAASAVAASGGAMALTVGAAVAAGCVGGTLGALLARFADGWHARRLLDQLERGGILLWVRTLDAEAERSACDILARNGGERVHVHALPAATARHDGGVSEELAWINKPLSAWFSGPTPQRREPIDADR